MILLDLYLIKYLNRDQFSHTSNIATLLKAECPSEFVCRRATNVLSLPLVLGVRGFPTACDTVNSFMSIWLVPSGLRPAKSKCLM